MPAFLAICATAVGAFAATNIDDFVVLTTLFATVGRGGPGRSRIIAGQYLGMATLLGVSAVAAVALLAVSERWLGLLGLVPIALGVHGLIVSRRVPHDDSAGRIAAPVRGVLGVAGVTIANGADNISVYTPLLHQGSYVSGVAIFASVFTVLVAAWCVVALSVAGRQPVIALVEATGHWLVPTVFIVIGLVIVARSGLLGR